MNTGEHVRITIDLDTIPMGCTHNLMCWVCGENKAVYLMDPTWCFAPCWECNREIGGTLQRKRKWWRR